MIHKVYGKAKTALVFIVCISLFYSFIFLSKYNNVLRYQTMVVSESEDIIWQVWFNRDDQFLINTTGCRIENIDPFDPQVVKFIWKLEKIKCDGEILTYISKEGDDVYLNVNQTLANNGSLECSYQGLERDMTASRPDNNVYFTSNLSSFTNKTVIKNQTVIRVVCENKYENYHYIFNNEKQSNVYNESKPNVLLIGLDAMSRSSLLRTMNKTVEFIKQNGWINLKGYNKILHNTCPNLMAATAGIEPRVTGCDNHTNMKWQDYKDFVWYDYKANNYTTLYSEDFPQFSTYNYGKKGFLNQPTDYYLRPYFVALRKLPIKDFCGLEQCFGPENIGPRMVEFVKNYVATVKKRSNFFGFFWMNSFSHSSLSCPTNMDEPISELFQHLKSEGVFDNTVVIFFSDHGFRFGKITETHAGWLENRLPFMFVSMPKMLRLQHREKYLNLIGNSGKLTSPYDLFMTLHHILNLHNDSYVVRKPSSGCDNCHSLFEPISSERTCSDAGIPEYWCTCSKYVQAEKNDTMAQKAAQYAVQYVNNLINGTNCTQYSFNETLEVKFYKTSGATVKNIMLRVQMEPPAKFELNINVKRQRNDKTVNFTTLDIERLDRYAEISWCCDKKNLRRYCYCAGSKDA